ncbi:MAG: glucose-6-phosphate dehydrogenase, partial [Pyrinomonadaceae bacterium]|nr:glucose-6-phosphate dehydrogenase [Pyrinomonadaceae bacterium]
MVSESTATENPLRESMRFERAGRPCVVIIFGASGDLAKRKLLPALYRLVQQRILPAEFAIVGLSRTPMSHDEYRDRM